jgi:hypothetical protein
LLYGLAKKHIEESPVSSAIPSGRKLDFGSEVRVCGIVRLERFKHEVWRSAGRGKKRDPSGFL